VPAQAHFCTTSQEFSRRLHACQGLVLHVSAAGSLLICGYILQKTKPGLYVCCFVLLLLPVNVNILVNQTVFLSKKNRGKLWCSIKCCLISSSCLL